MFSAHPEARPLLVTLPFLVQTYDIDYAGHVNNCVYVRWLEDLRMAMMRAWYPPEKMIEDETVFILHSTHITYKKSIMITDAPEGQMWCSKLGRATMSVHAEFMVDGNRCAHATQRGILLRHGSTKAVRLPQNIIDVFQKQNVPA